MSNSGTNVRLVLLGDFNTNLKNSDNIVTKVLGTQFQQWKGLPEPLEKF